MDVVWCGDVIYGRDASALRSREVKKRTRPDYSTRTERNVQLSAPKLGLRRVVLRDPEVTSYVGYWLIDVPAKTFSIYSHSRCLHSSIPATLVQTKFRTGDSVTKRFIYATLPFMSPLVTLYG